MHKICVPMTANNGWIMLDILVDMTPGHKFLISNPSSFQCQSWCRSSKQQHEYVLRIQRCCRIINISSFFYCSTNLYQLKLMPSNPLMGLQKLKKKTYFFSVQTIVVVGQQFINFSYVRHDYYFGGDWRLQKRLPHAVAFSVNSKRTYT